MTPRSIKTHLESYSIYTKRRTTIAHAFASALAPLDEYHEEKVKQALVNLGQVDLNRLTCVYCGGDAETWDHLVNLVRGGELNGDGYGHQIGNLVPCCAKCNSSKGLKSFSEFVRGMVVLEEKKADLIHRLNTHLALAKPMELADPDEESQKVLEEFKQVKDQIFQLMKTADQLAEVLRRGAQKKS